MTTDSIKELVKRLRDPYGVGRGNIDAMADEAAAALAAMAGEVERITKERDDLDANGIHTCHDNCTKHFCVMRRRMQAAESERDRLAGEVERLKGVLVEIAGTLEGAPDDEGVKDLYDLARSALEAKP